MRIIVGRFKGMTIEAPRGVLSRPPLAVIRESVFDTVGDHIECAAVLDLFAGSGSLGIESLSRGALSAHFVDSAARCTRLIGRNLRSLGIEDACRITRQDALGFLSGWSGGRFGIVFVDPPFLSGMAQGVLAALAASIAAGDGTVVIIRTHWREAVDIPDCFTLLKRRKFGESVVRFLRKREPRSTE